jgi:hypothetical protein
MRKYSHAIKLQRQFSHLSNKFIEIELLEVKMGDGERFLNHLNVKEVPSPPKAKSWTIQPIIINDELIEWIREEIARSYLPITTFEELFQTADMNTVFEHLRARNFPQNEKILKGNFGEILCQICVKDGFEFEVPYPKIRLRIDREPSPHGEDVVGFIFRDNGPDVLILVEAKFRTGNIPAAIREAHDTIGKSINGQSECFLLNAVLAFIEATGDQNKCHRINAMLTDYHGEHFEKIGAIFIVSPECEWKDENFIEQLTDNHIDPLWCWGFIVKDLVDLLKRTH